MIITPIEPSYKPRYELGKPTPNLRQEKYEAEPILEEPNKVDILV